MIRKFGILLSALLAFFFTNVSFAQTFEGTITMEISSAKLQQPMTMVISTKGEKSATEMQTSQGSMKMYFDKTEGKMTTVIGKMGIQMDIKEAMDKAKEKKKDALSSKVTATGEKQVINGHTCELYIVTAKDSNRSNWWMTADLPKSLLNSLHNIYNNSARAPLGARSGSPGMEAIGEMFKKGLVPIKVEILKEGKPETTMSFVSYEQKHLDNSVFEIPKDVIFQPLPTGMSGMGKE